MPLQTVKQPGFFTFGTGILIGLGAAFAMRSTLPRATEMMGLVMQKMGFEFGDILLALWDPEAQQAALAEPVAALPAPQKKQASSNRAHPKAVRRNSKAPVLKLPRRGRATVPAKANGKAPKLPFSRRSWRSNATVRLN